MYEEEVTRGATTLDAHDPTWRSRINVDALRLADITTCVVGQALGVTHYGRVGQSLDATTSDVPALGWDDALDRLGAPVHDDPDTEHVLRDAWCVERGFESRFIGRVNRSGYHELHLAWVVYLLGSTS